jgi:hypothetical protein
LLTSNTTISLSHHQHLQLLPSPASSATLPIATVLNRKHNSQNNQDSDHHLLHHLTARLTTIPHKQLKMPPRTYTKTFLPLESNPQIFTSLAHNLGLSSSLRFIEVYDLDEQPEEEVLAYVLAFPTSEGYDDEVEARDEKELSRKEEDPTGKVEGNNGTVFWLRQTIHNACGLYALLHATCNGVARKHISTPFHSYPSFIFHPLTASRTQFYPAHPHYHTTPAAVRFALLITRARNLVHRSG